LFEALDSPAFVGKLNRIEDLEAEWTKSWESLTIDTPSEPIGKVSAAIPSVVTVSASDGHGSGCILSSDGYIVTNYHVIADGSLDYLIHFHDGSVLPATVVRYHPLYDLALLKVDTVGLTPFHVLTNGAIEVGEEAFALGTPYDIDLGASVTKGIISGKRKDGNRTLIQTDVSISPGNSGGALIDSDGTLIGVVNEKVLGTGVEGIGFAIPAAVLSEALMLEFKR
jgi:S1-C subfamily serine protease